ncbi:unnamed protein product [Didymodactylos carnosus]|uniref:Uncharacterized protein n=1 Tax=Didymodactylos carnosus TaxID=1234261 RepID=A0A814F4D2_9BILA|nr:unnamed protein product [Didymodactylos carnosus]CAF0977791.1 unnamed protein product [Didymodactylos carnosus]CAF3580775.1 unnamed protein product [Didymodactylos carnosus]CAF3750623.1 unnamed protein product [Didymodactylos carnosus]
MVTSFTTGGIIGISLCVISLLLHLIAYFTPHWKEVVPNSNALYVDGVDALIRGEVLHYFNAVHRYTKHSYGIFQRCERLLNNINLTISLLSEKEHQSCTKNYLPSYQDINFNECHSLEYYQFCTKANKKIFDIQNHYLLQKFAIDNLKYSKENQQKSALLCNCRYPRYALTCRYLSAITIIFILLTIIFYTWVALSNKKMNIKKLIGAISSFCSIIFLMLNLIVMNNYLKFEPLEYLVAIEKHYRAKQIYKFSEDMKITMQRFHSSVTIKNGYSMALEWTAFCLTIITAIILLITTKKSDHKPNTHISNDIESRNKQHLDGVRDQSSLDAMLTTNSSQERFRIKRYDEEV